MRLSGLLAAIVCWGTIGVSSTAQAAFVTYFDDDNSDLKIDTDTTAGNGYNAFTMQFVGRPASVAHSQDGFNAFLSGISLGSDIGVEDFERFAGQNPSGSAANPIHLDLQFDRLPPGAGTLAVQADLDGVGQVAKITDPNVNSAGRFPVWIDANGTPLLGDQYFDTNFNQLSFAIQFSAPITAFGFFGTDVGDFDGQIQLAVTPTVGADEILTVPHLRSGTTGELANSLNATLIFFGFTSDTPFTRVTFTNVGQFPDRFGFDKLVIATQAVPEPSTLALLACGVFCAGGARLWRRKQSGGDVT